MNGLRPNSQLSGHTDTSQWVDGLGPQGMSGSLGQRGNGSPGPQLNGSPGLRVNGISSLPVNGISTPRVSGSPGQGSQEMAGISRRTSTQGASGISQDQGMSGTMNADVNGNYDIQTRTSSFTRRLETDFTRMSLSPQGSRGSIASATSTPTFRYTCDSVRQHCAGPAVNNFVFVNNHFGQPGDYNIRLAMQGDMFRPFSGTFSTDGSSPTEAVRAARTTPLRVQREMMRRQKEGEQAEAMTVDVEEDESVGNHNVV